MAQLVEQRIRNAWVPGSSPGIGSKVIRKLFSCGISTSVVHGLPKPGRRVRFPYSAPEEEHVYTNLTYTLSQS